MQAGSLNRRVVLQLPAAGQDALGQPTTGWTTLATVWANVQTLSGLETIRHGAQASIVAASIRIRRRADVTAGMRVVLGATVFHVNAVRQDEANREVTDLVCEAIE